MTSDEALADRTTLDIGAATAELARHYCRVLEVSQTASFGLRLLVTNDLDDAEWVACTPSAILIWLGY